MTTAHRRLYEAAAAGNLTTYLQQQQEVERLFIITYIQVGPAAAAAAAASNTGKEWGKPGVCDNAELNAAPLARLVLAFTCLHSCEWTCK